MLNSGRAVLVCKGLPTIVCAALVLLALVMPTTAGACEPSNGCGNDTSSNSTLSASQFSNSTILFTPYSNKTSLGTNSTLGFWDFSNSTSLNRTNLANLQEKLGIVDSVVVNFTNQTVPLPIKSFTPARDELQTKNDKGSTPQIKGSADEGTNSSLPTLQALGISAWVKPDYGQGSAIFTVVSDDDAFVLAVNNNMPPVRLATFSVFDGIKWTTVQSTTEIPDKWTHLAATFNGTSIMIFVDGTLENTANVGPIPALVDGKLTVQTSQNLTSDANVTIGAYYEKERAKTRDVFSGAISNVNLYDVSLSQEQIQQIFQATRPGILSASSK
ncbi:MAG TPA: LamG domain-containing protein [Candidatus Nitrosotalea sp.]|nr:LamG domain-containing protein [Candidatus Nitrosotalea sp.]